MRPKSGSTACRPTDLGDPSESYRPGTNLGEAKGGPQRKVGIPATQFGASLRTRGNPIHLEVKS